MKTILLIDGSVGPTGALLAAANTSRVLQDDADLVLVVDRSAEVPDEISAAFHAVVFLPLCLPRRSLSAMLDYVFCLPLSALRLRSLCRRFGADSLIFNDFYFAQGALLRLTGFRGRIVTWVRMDSRRFGHLGSCWLWLARWSSDRVVAVSNHIRQILGGMRDVEIIYDPVCQRLESERLSEASIPIEETPPTFVFIGNYIEGKGQDLALDALARARKRNPKICIEFYGGDLGLERNRSYLRRLRNQAQALGLEEAVVLNGYTEQPMTAFRGKRAALVLSRSESFSMTALEASSAGLPVIATRCGGPEEIVAEGETGLLVPVDDAEATADALYRLAADAKLAATMGVSGRARVSELFSQAKFERQVRRLLGLQSSKGSPVA